MDEAQSSTSTAVGVAAAALADDPRPVYAGDWKTATGAQKGAHAEAVRLWKERNGIETGVTARRRMDAGSEQPVSRLSPAGAAPLPVDPLPAGDAASRRVLEEIRDDHRALSSDRIRAAQALISMDRGPEATPDSDLVQLRAVLETLQPAERLAWLQGERAAALRVQPRRV